jgi:hypothetical protein
MHFSTIYKQSYLLISYPIIYNVEKKMKNGEFALLLTTLAVFAATSIGLSYAYNMGNSYHGMMDIPPNELEGENWWNDMKTHMEEHWNNLEGEDWMEEMSNFMEEQEIDNHNTTNHHGCH